jgi:hypothetical protein
MLGGGKPPEGVKKLIFVFWGPLRINNLQAQKSRFFNFFTASPSRPANFRSLIGVD